MSAGQHLSGAGLFVSLIHRPDHGHAMKTRLHPLVISLVLMVVGSPVLFAAAGFEVRSQIAPSVFALPLIDGAGNVTVGSDQSPSGGDTQLTFLITNTGTVELTGLNVSAA